MPAGLVDRPAHRAIASDRGDSNRQYGCGLRAFGACLLQLASSAGVCIRNALSARRRTQSPAGLVPTGGARGICPPVARLSAPRRAWRAERSHDGAKPRQRNGDGARKKGTPPHLPLVGRWAARRRRLSGSGPPQASLGARGARGMGRLLLTEWRHPLTKNSLTLLFMRLSQRAGFTKTPICPSMLRDTYAIRFLQAGGRLTALREQLGVAGLASVKRYQHFCEQRKEERQAQACPEESMPTRQSQRGKRRRRQERRPGRGSRLSQR